MNKAQQGFAGHRDRTEGLVVGFALKVIRESVNLTQEELADQLSVDPQTVQAWESGRRPLTATRVGGLVKVRQRLRSLGASPSLLDSLNAGLEADYILTHALKCSGSADPREHPLARWVLTREVSELLAWPFTGETPAGLRGVALPSRRGPVASAPVLSASEKKVFFEHFRAAAEESLSLGGTEDSSAENVLLRRQAYYHLTWSKDAEMREWLEKIQRQEQRDLPRAYYEWSPKWVAARSLAVALARVGDKEPLAHFIRTGLATDQTEAANLRYWAYWVSERSGGEHSDRFMMQPSNRWFGDAVLQRLHDGLSPDNACIDLYAHSICALLKRESYLLERDTGFRGSLRESAEELLSGSEISSQSRKELEELVGFVNWIGPN